SRGSTAVGAMAASGSSSGRPGATGTTGTTGTTGATAGAMVDGVTVPLTRPQRATKNGEAGAGMPKINLLVIQPTPFCNIDCRYCYLPNRSSKAVGERATLVNLFSQVFQSGWARDRLTVIWHACEPMVMPIGFYRDAFELVAQLKPTELSLTHAFQTNGTLIDDEWCEFLLDARVNVGVS